MKVAIVGCNELGTTIAQKLADGDWPGEVLLVDPEPGTAEGKALDLLQASPVLRTGTQIRGSREMAAIEDSSYILIAQMDDSFEKATQFFRSLGALDQTAVVLLAINEPARLMAASAARFPPERVLATAPEALASTWRHYLAEALGFSHQDVAVSLLGAPPREGFYLAFTSLAGQPVEKLLSPAELRRVAREVTRRSVPGPRNLATAAVNVLQDMLRKKGAIRSCYVWSGGKYGRRGLFLCAPSVLGPPGLQQVIEFALEPAQQVTIDRSLDFLERLQQLRPHF